MMNTVKTRRGKFLFRDALYFLRAKKYCPFDKKLPPPENMDTTACLGKKAVKEPENRQFYGVSATASGTGYEIYWDM